MGVQKGRGGSRFCTALNKHVVARDTCDAKGMGRGQKEIGEPRLVL